jgi:hypothetical protein
VRLVRDRHENCVYESQRLASADRAGALIFTYPNAAAGHPVRIGLVVSARTFGLRSGPPANHPAEAGALLEIAALAPASAFLSQAGSIEGER